MLAKILLSLKQKPCPRCGRTGFLIRHGFLRGYADSGEAICERGQRFFCSNRYRRGGCGKTFCILFAEILPRMALRASTFWKYIDGVRRGLSRKAAWEQLRIGPSLQTGYRLWRRLERSQTALRSLLAREGPPPAAETDQPIFQLLAHMETAFAQATCPISAFQARFQHPFLS